jgi:hypothetical protein
VKVPRSRAVRQIAVVRLAPALCPPTASRELSQLLAVPFSATQAVTSYAWVTGTGYGRCGATA